MSFPLSRLPFLAIKEVIKSMRTREIFYLSLLSKKSQNFVMLSIPKNTLSAKFTFHNDGLLFELKPVDFDEPPMSVFRADGLVTIQESTSFMRVSASNLHFRCYLFSPSVVEKSMREPFYRILKTFKKSKIYIRFEDDTREEFAMEMIRFAWGSGFLLAHVDFRMNNASPESIQELLNVCNKHHTSLYIGTKIPEGFKCTPPPGGYKFKSFEVDDAHWVNLDDFLLCREVFFRGGVPGLTNEYLNGLLKKIVNLECRIESFALNLRNQPSDFAQIVRGLSESAIKRNGPWEELQFERNDGRKLLIYLYGGYYLKMTIV